MSRSIVIVFDCLPAHWLGCYGNFDVESPAFDWLATQSVVFDRHIATSPGESELAALLTGRYQKLDSAVSIPPGTPPDQIGKTLAKTETDVVWLWMDTSPNSPATDDDGAESYHDQVDECDEILTESLEQIEAAGWRDALLIVTAACGDRGDEDEGQFTDLRLPLLIRHPQVAGFRLQSITQPIDLYPTLNEWSGNTPPDEIDGASLLPLIKGESDGIRDRGFFNNRTHVGIVDDDFILTQDRNENSQPQLFLQPHDRWMIHDVAVEYPDVVDELKAVMDARSL